MRADAEWATQTLDAVTAIGAVSIVAPLCHAVNDDVVDRVFATWYPYIAVAVQTNGALHMITLWLNAPFPDNPYGS